MKKTNLTLAILLALSLSSFASTIDDANPFVKASFKTEFRNAEVIRWDTQKDFIKATFKMNGSIMFAYYGLDGKLIAVSRNIASTQLPIDLASDLSKNYSSYWITDLFEIDMNGETFYYATIENPDNVTILQSAGGSDWIVYKKHKKVE